MRDKIQQIREKALAEIDKADGLEKLNDVRAAILGKKILNIHKNHFLSQAL